MSGSQHHHKWWKDALLAPLPTHVHSPDIPEVSCVVEGKTVRTTFLWLDFTLELYWPWMVFAAYSPRSKIAITLKLFMNAVSTCAVKQKTWYINQVGMKHRPDCGGVHQCSTLIESKCMVLACKAINAAPCGSIYNLFNYVHFSLHTDQSQQHYPHILSVFPIYSY